MPRPRPNGNNNLPGKPPVWLPLGGKLSPQVTDEGLPTGSFPLIRRVPRHLPPRGKAFPAGDEVTPPYIAIFPPASLSYQYARAARTPYLLFIIFYLLSIIYFAPQGHSRPRWCTDPQHPGKLQQKNSLTFSVRLYFGAPSGTRTQDPLIKSQLLSQVTSAKSSFESSYCCFKTQFF